MKKYTWMCFVLTALVLGGCGAQKTKSYTTGNMALATYMDTVSYSLGANIASNLQAQGMDTIQMDVLAKAMNDVYQGNEELLIDAEKAEMILSVYFRQLEQRKTERLMAKGREFLEANKNKEGVVELPSGLQYKVIREGEGKSPTIQSGIVAHYRGTLIDGTEFDSSYNRGEPLKFPLSKMIRGWQEGLPLMKEGGKWEFYIPYEMGYGKAGYGSQIPPYSALVFEIELLEVND